MCKNSPLNWSRKRNRALPYGAVALNPNSFIFMHFRQKNCQVIGWRTNFGVAISLENAGFTTVHWKEVTLECSEFAYFPKRCRCTHWNSLNFMLKQPMQFRRYWTYFQSIFYIYVTYQCLKIIQLWCLNYYSDLILEKHKLMRRLLNFNSYFLHRVCIIHLYIRPTEYFPPD